MSLITPEGEVPWLSKNNISHEEYHFQKEEVQLSVSTQWSPDVLGTVTAKGSMTDHLLLFAQIP